MQSLIRQSALIATLFTALLAAPAPARTPTKAPARTLARHAIVVAANPLATEAGLAVLRAGGSAVDAAVAVQAVLGLVEPQSSGLGGGAFMLYYDAKTHSVTAYNGRETAPKAADPQQFLGADGKPLPFVTAVLGGIATGVPGAIAMLDLAHHQHGHLPWASLFANAHALATTGFTVSPRLAGMIASRAPQAAAPDARAYFSHADGTKLTAGETLRNPAYAASLDAVAAKGASGLLTGAIAQDIVARTNQAPLPSHLTLADLASYQPRAEPALCRPYRAVMVCTPPAPSGGPAVLEALGLLAHTDINQRGASDPQAWFSFAEASRLAYADRDRYEGDPAFVSVPIEGLLAPDYLAARARLIGTTAAATVSPGQPAGASPRARDTTMEPGGTSHFVIVDSKGNVVSMTTTVESIFGSGRMVDGFFLNNQLTDFAFSPLAADGTMAANAVAGGKHPRSSMAPTIVLDRHHRFVAALGSPGGNAIIAYNLKVLVALIDWKMAPQAAAALPNLVARGTSFTAEPFSAPVMAALAARGLPLRTSQGENSGIHIVMRRANGYEGGVDPRREGLAKGF